MSIPNRTVSITGVFAADASTTIPTYPVSGASYRDTTMTGTVVREGWAYKTIVDSSKFNQAMFEYSSVTSQLEKYGFLPWSNLTDYEQGSLCLGSDGNIYQARQATGPSTTAYDPVSNLTVWQNIVVGVTEFLFHHIWTDYQLNRQDWLRGDTFSWQSGTVYTNAYSHLVADISGISSSTETVGSYTITYYQATDGHKIVLADQETTVENIYNESGVAWYYILDTTNTRFKLPRENPAREELIQIVRAKGNGKTVGFTDGTDNGGTYRLQMTSLSGSAVILLDKNSYGSEVGQTATTDRTWGSSSITAGITTDSTKSGIISSMTDSTSVYKGKKYLYFYIGQFSQSATEQNAGINTELFNGKVDLNAHNLSDAGKSLIAGFGMQSDTCEDLTLLASGSEYTAPANGYYFLNKGATGSNQYIAFIHNSDDSTKRYQDIYWGPTSGSSCMGKTAVLKGEKITISYTVGGSNPTFRFYYAKGSESEAS